VEVVASISQGRTAAAQCGLFTHKSVPVIFEPPCRWPKHVELFMLINHNCCIKLAPLVILIYDARSHIHQATIYFAGSFLALRKNDYQLRQVCPSTCNNSVITGQIFTKFDI